MKFSNQRRHKNGLLEGEIRRAPHFGTGRSGCHKCRRGGRKFDASDAAFASIKLWRDWNQASMGESGGLLIFAALDIQGIGLPSIAGNVDLGWGNTQSFSSGFTRVGGQTGASGTAEFTDRLLLANNNLCRQLTDADSRNAKAPIYVAKQP
jgi:hypothetical protein